MGNMILFCLLLVKDANSLMCYESMLGDAEFSIGFCGESDQLSVASLTGFETSGI